MSRAASGASGVGGRSKKSARGGRCRRIIAPPCPGSCRLVSTTFRSRSTSVLSVLAPAGAELRAFAGADLAFV